MRKYHDYEVYYPMHYAKRVVEGVGISIDDLVLHFYFIRHNNYAMAIIGPTPVCS